MQIISNGFNLKFSHPIGEGGFAKVYLAKDIIKNKKYAVKFVQTSKMKPKELQLFQNEKNILNLALVNNFPNIIKIHAIFKDSAGNYYIVLDYCNGGSLHKCFYEYYNTHGRPFPEKYVRYLMKEILLGVNSLHQYGVIHRDLKLGNILLNYKNEIDKINNNILNAEVKIIDFNASYYPNNLQPINGIEIIISEPKTAIGTVPYMSPSVLLNGLKPGNQIPYDKKADIWSLGVLCYEMLFAKKPFGNYQNYETYQNILHANFDIPKTISIQARNFLNCMLILDSNKRYSARRLLLHEFIVKNNYNEYNEYNQTNYFTIDINDHPQYNTLNLEPKIIQPKKNQNSHIIINHPPINIVFKDNTKNKLINIVTNSNAKIIDVFNTFLMRIDRPDLLFNPGDSLRFIFSGKRLSYYNFSNTIRELGINNGNVIEAFYKK